MKRTTLYRMVIVVIGLALLLSCSGSITVNGTVKDTTDSSQPNTAVLTLASKVSGGIPDGTVIGGYDVTVTLPAGVTVKSTNPPQTDDGVVTLTGAGTGATLSATYTPASGSGPAKVRIMVAKGSGMSAGEFAKVNCDITEGNSPAISDFPPPTFTASGFDTTSNSTVDLTGQLAMTESVTMDGGTLTRACTYNYTDWSPCKNGTQSRLWISSSPEGCEGTPILSQTCNANTTHTLISIVVYPKDMIIDIGAGDHYQLHAEGFYYDATQENITSAVSWSSSDTSIATVNNSGEVTVNTGATPGTTVTITAKQGNISDMVTVNVVTGGGGH